MLAHRLKSNPLRGAFAWTLLSALLLCGCERIAPIRTLPSWVRGVYIPVFHNVSFEPAIEEQATMLTQEAFLSDGQVGVVPKTEADATLLVKIKDWREKSSGTSGEHVTDAKRYTIVASVLLVEPFDETQVIANLGDVSAVQNFNIDTRSVSFAAEPDIKTQLLTGLANQIVSKTMSGFPANVTPYGNTASPATSPQDIHSEDVLRGKAPNAY